MPDDPIPPEDVEQLARYQLQGYPEPAVRRAYLLGRARALTDLQQVAVAALKLVANDPMMAPQVRQWARDKLAVVRSLNEVHANV